MKKSPTPPLRVIASSVALLLLLTPHGHNAHAQDQVTGAFQGTVAGGDTRKGIAGASIEITEVYTGAKYRRVTDAEGNFYIGRLSPGVYKFEMSAPGYKARVVEQRLLISRVNMLLPVPVTLEPTAATNAPRPAPGTTGSLAVASVSNALVSVESADGEVKLKNAVPPGQLLCVFDDLPPKHYRVTAELEGYKTEAGEVSVSASKTSSLTLNLSPTESSAQLIAQTGKYYALVIGNNDYSRLPRLRTAEADAEAVASLLRERYGFETTLLLNANRAKIMEALYTYRHKIEQGSNLLIYYAGHGYNDAEVEKAYWLPVDAGEGDNANWISADDITTNVKAIPARHILIISDSCYSGTIARDVRLNLAGAGQPARAKYLERMAAGRSRTLLASGGDEPVADSGGRGHSVFAGALLTGLSEMNTDIFTAEEIYINFIKEAVTGKSSQTPEYNPIRNSGHENGDFIFVRKRQ